MFNYNSPIVNNVLGGSQIPPNPIMNFGNGYNQNNNVTYIDPIVRQQPMQPQYSVYPNMMNNSGYYNGIYNGYYNPYLAQRQQELMEIEMKAQAEKSANIWKRLSRACNEALHIEIEDWDEHLKQYDPVFKQKTVVKSTLRVKLVSGDGEVICDPEISGYYSRVVYKEDEDLQIENLIRMESNAIPFNVPLAQRVIQNNNTYDQSKAKFGDRMGLAEYLDNAGELYSEALMNQYIERKNNLKNAYDSNAFQKVLQQNRGYGYFSGTFAPEFSPGMKPGPSLGSLEVTVPSHLGSKYNEVRQRFMEAILNNSGG